MPSRAGYPRVALPEGGKPDEVPASPGNTRRRCRTGPYSAGCGSAEQRAERRRRGRAIMALRHHPTPLGRQSQGTGRTGAAVAEVDLGFGDIFGDFNFGVMGLLERGATPGSCGRTFLRVARGRAGPFGGRQRHPSGRTEGAHGPAGGGLRHSQLTLGRGGCVARCALLAAERRSQRPASGAFRGPGWVDGTVGAALRYQPAERWHLFAKSDGAVDRIYVAGAWRHRL